MEGQIGGGGEGAKDTFPGRQILWRGQTSNENLFIG